MTKVVAGVCFLGIALLSGCATTGSLDDTRARYPDRIMSAVYDAPMEEVYTAAKLACLDLGLAVESENPIERKIYARTTANMAKVFMFGTGYGEWVGIYFAKVDENKTKVEVATQKSYQLDWGFKDYRGSLLSVIKAHLQTKAKN